MSGFNVSIATAIKRFGNKITFLQPMLEAITNSLEAGAKNIKIKFYIDKTKNLFDTEPNKVSSYEIEDDGEGFTERNINSFLTYMSEMKLSLGCKGVGRITWLKVFNHVNIKSYINEKKVSFIFDENFSEESVKIKEDDNKKPRTIIKFYGVRKQYFERGKEDKRVDADLGFIRHYIEENLLIKLSLLKSQNINFNISIIDDKGDKTDPICNDSLTTLSEQKFSVRGKNDNEIEFNIYYSFFNSDGRQKKNAYYCANGRIVTAIPDKVSFTSLPENKSSILLVTSDFFDKHVNDERNEFDIPQSENRLDCELSWEEINFNLQYAIDSILINEFPHLKEENEKNISELIDDFPYLAKYIRADNSKIKDKEKVLAASKKKYEQEKERISKRFKDLLDKNDLDSEAFSNSVDDVTDMSARELAEYIVYRQQIILALHKLNTNREKSEKKLHNLFMKRGDEYFNNVRETYDHNLWLFDDKFMTYVYAASDVTIRKYEEALTKLNVYNSPYRPDLAVFFSNKEDDDSKDAIVIEFKACGASLDEKSKSFWEIIRNAQAIRESINNINRIWCYTITSFDDVFINNIMTQDFIPLFTNGVRNEVFYRFYKHINAHCYYVSLDALLADAESRNNIFLDIIKKTDK